MIREDRELLSELARLGTAMPSLALRIMDDSAGAREQQNYARPLIAAGERLRQRANGASGLVVEGQVLAMGALALPVHTVEPGWKA